MSFYVNYQKVLKRIEEKAKARSKKDFLCPNEEVYFLDGGHLRLYTPGSFYLESMKIENKTCN